MKMLNKLRERNEELIKKYKILGAKYSLSDINVSEDKLEALSDELAESFGANTLLTPKNIVKTNRFDISAPEVSIKISPEHRDLVTTQTIDNVKYLMIRVDGGVEVNGINIKFD